MTAKIYTTTKFRVRKAQSGRFVPEYSTFGTWERWAELGTTATRARRGDAERFIQRKADRLYFGNAPITFVDQSAPAPDAPASQGRAEDIQAQIQAKLARALELSANLWRVDGRNTTLAEQQANHAEHYQIQIWLEAHGAPLHTLVGAE
jgi:hypothetical protein